MKKITKIITFYDDGTFTESTPYVGAPMPFTRPLVPPDPLPEPYWNKKQCPKCGLNLDGPLGYVCPQPQCPTGLGGVWCNAGGDCV